MEKQEDELYGFLQGIELLQYYEVFRREGFERLESIADIQESDFEALGVKRGHRRFIQRKALELVNPLQYPRELPPIGSPLLAIHHTHQSTAEPNPSSSLEKREPLTAYLHRQHIHHQQPQQPQSQSQQPQQSQQMAQAQASSAQPQAYYPPHPYYHHRYSPQPKQPSHLTPSQQQSQVQQTQHSQSLPRRSQMQSLSGYPHIQRLSVPFPKPSSDVAARSTPTSPEHPPSAVGGMVRSPGTLGSQQQPASAAQAQAQEKPGIAIPSTQGGPSQSHQITMRASSYSQKSVSASTEDPSPQRTRAPESPFSGTYQHTPPISSIMRSPTMRQRQRGQSMSSVTTSGRRRDSRSEHKLPYSRPTGDTQSPKSPQAQVSSAIAQSPRRTYRRHPKKDPNAPEKWRSAYQLFRDDVNRELHGQDIPFSEMSKIHSKRWAELGDEKRTVYFERSRQDKEEYAAKMAVYEKTPEFRQYSEYLDKFYKQESTVNRVGRPKGTKSSKARGKGPDVSMSEDYDYENSPSIGAAKPSASASSSPPPSMSSIERSPG